MAKTKPCPLCDNELELPTEYLDAIERMRNEVTRFVGAPIHDALKRVEELETVLQKAVNLSMIWVPTQEVVSCEFGNETVRLTELKNEMETVLKKGK